MARRNKGRRIDGVFLLDKPQGCSSNFALQRVKRIYDAAKAGHTGALDPLATGLLPICLGEATKFSQFLLDSDKRYITTAKLGVRTDSSDADGEVIETKPVPAIDRAELEALLERRFLGKIEQVPSMFSALKHNGQPLYKLARKGEKVEVKPRQVTIFEIKLLDLRTDEIDLEVHCSKGTYIRSIVEDLGFELGCGAHVSMLRRTEVADYDSSQMLTLEQLEDLARPAVEGETQECIQTRLDAVLFAPWSAVERFPSLELSDILAARLLQGQKLGERFEQRGLVRLFENSRFLGLGEVDETGRLRAKRLLDTSENAL
jgi:tRNA pseudouridine55 synthase